MVLCLLRNPFAFHSYNRKLIYPLNIQWNIKIKLKNLLYEIYYTHNKSCITN